MPRRNLILGEVAFMVILAAVTVWLFRSHSPSPDAVAVGIKLPDASSQVYLQRQSDGSLVYLIRNWNGNVQRVSTDQMSQRLYDLGQSSWSSLGLSSPVVLFWLTVGFVGQLLFTGRFVVQYIASERKKKSVVPPVFWWFSLIGSLILLSYFLWRRDPIGLLGQAFGSFIYLRNILWIRNESRPSVLTVPEAS
jgi:lipid-A-disaccharide synthase-like uncharacterized protein